MVAISMPCLRYPDQRLYVVGRMPIANGFLTANEFPTNISSNLRGVLQRVGMFQIMEQPSGKCSTSNTLFSSTSRHMQAHFEGLRMLC